MSFAKFTTNISFIKKVRLKNNNANLKNEMIGILKEKDSLCINNNFVDFKYEDSHYEIEHYFNATKCAIARILTIKNDIATLEINIFTTPLKEIYNDMYIKLDEKLLTQVKEQDFILNINNKQYIIITSGDSLKESLFLDERQQKQNEIKKLKSKLENERHDQKAEAIQKQIEQKEQELDKLEIDNIAFGLINDSNKLAIESIDLQQDKTIYRATKLMPNHTNKDMPNLRLIQIGKLFFKDGSVGNSIKEALESGKLDSQYLEMWDRYINEEGEALLQKAREIGEIKVKNIDGWDIKIDKDLREKLKVDDYISIMTEQPIYLKDKNMSFKDYAESELKKDAQNQKREKEEIYKVEKVTSESIQIEKTENLDLDSLKNTTIVFSIFGDFIQFKRKIRARQRMLNGKSANPRLPMLFANEINKEIKHILQTSTRNANPALSQRVKAIFKTPPTNNQIEAIQMAINTPDIAIIQGPPGTGKTTVINAIIERLNELSDKSGSKKGSIFIGAYQHAAVENLIERMNLNGLPTPKHGKKSMETQSITSYESIRTWAEKIAQNIELKEDSILIKKIKDEVASYALRPSLSKQEQILKLLTETSEPMLRKCRDKAREILKEMKKNNEFAHKDLVYIHSIRDTKSSFEDDGLLRHRELLASKYKDHISEDDKKILLNEHFDTELVNLKQKLLKHFSPKANFAKQKADKELVELTEEAINCLNNLDNESKINLALAEFKNTLTSNPFALKEMIGEYSIAFASSMGQSMGNEILKAKGIRIDDITKQDAYSYDSVIIDEAAMVSPLDLFLVLVLAKQRIILVGDHRQLPHRLEDKIVKRLENGEDNNKIEASLLKESLFSWLKNRAEELEKIDNVKRFITLNNQFRTHPLLGQLCSDIFYKEHGEGYNSPREAQEFRHSLNGIEDKCAVWIDMPHDRGKEIVSNESRKRECEAQIIIKKLLDWLDSESGATLSYGVISFYSAQVKLIQELLDKEKNKATSRMLKDRLSRVKIGSVDSFQGMEFDVVFLSVVRSGRVKKGSSPKALFGFLCVPNRLCVSMSRQKKVLIAVGDKAYFKTPEAQEFVKGLYEFATLCESSGVVL